jgi:hypothetical protein
MNDVAHFIACSRVMEFFYPPISIILDDRATAQKSPVRRAINPWENEFLVLANF